MVDAPAIHIQKIQAETLRVPIVGTASLIVHAWSQKAKQAMLDAQQGRKTPKVNRDPDADYAESLYYLTKAGEPGHPDNVYGAPILAFKAATVGAARFFGKSVRMTELRQFLFMTGRPSHDNSALLAAIDGEPRMREDMVRVGMGTDLRYRAEFVSWRAVLDITYVSSALSRESVLSLVDAGGMGVGVGEWRPERRGQNGTYSVDPDREVEVVS